MRISQSVIILPALCAVAGAQAPVAVLPTDESVQASQSDELSPEELHIRTGITILYNLYECLSGVQDEVGAQAAVPVLVRITNELQVWGQKVVALPPLSEDDRERLVNTYIRRIRRLNDHLRAQGERLAAAGYYNSRDLATALASLYATLQQ